MDTIGSLFLILEVIISTPLLVWSLIWNSKNKDSTRKYAIPFQVLAIALFIGGLANCIVGLSLSGVEYYLYEEIGYYYRHPCCWVGMGLSIGSMVIGFIAFLVALAYFEKYRAKFAPKVEPKPVVKQEVPQKVETVKIVEPKPVPQVVPQPAPEPATAPTPAVKRSTNYIEEIKALKELLDCGAITEEEFSKKKKQVLGI